MVIGIIGAGASGMAAALTASENEQNQVIVFERHSRVGRKLQATGNGRCNLTNINADKNSYHGNAPDFVNYALDHFSADNTLMWFQKLGLYTVLEDSGRVYPYSDQANSVVDILRFALMRSNIQIYTGTEIKRIRKSENLFLLDNGERVWHCDRLIIACGGLAGTKLGGSMCGYKFLKAFGHSITRLRPALVQMKSSWNGCQALKGVRTNCDISVYKNGMLHSRSTGELQFTEYGLSGPVVFEVSRDACQGSCEWTCRLDFLPDIDEKTLFSWLSMKRKTELLSDELLTGILHNRLGRVLVSASGIRNQKPISAFSDHELKSVCRSVKGLEVQLTDLLGMDNAQVTAGGAVTDEFDAATMQSRIVPGLYACGEVLDIDGNCGGYNLQWAWSSGRLAGRSAGEVTA